MSSWRTDYETLAGRLGLRFRPAAVPGRVGELNGILRGHRVLVRPDRPALYVEYRFRVEGLWLSTVRPRGQAPDAFTTGDGAFDRALPGRRASPAAQAALREAGGAAADFRAQLPALLARWPGYRLEATCDGGQLTVTLLRRRGLAGLLRGLTGRGTVPPTADVAALLPDMLSIVEALEAALREHALRIAGGGRNGGTR